MFSKTFFRSLLHAVYGGATGALAEHAYSGGPITGKTVGAAVVAGAFKGLFHFFTTPKE